MILFSIVMQENERGLQFNYGMEVIKRKGDASSKDITLGVFIQAMNWKG